MEARGLNLQLEFCGVSKIAIDIAGYQLHSHVLKVPAIFRELYLQALFEGGRQAYNCRFSFV
jgi:hypothetical protein